MDLKVLIWLLVLAYCALGIFMIIVEEFKRCKHQEGDYNAVQKEEL